MALHKSIRNFTKDDYLPQFALENFVSEAKNGPLDLVEVIENCHHDYMAAIPSFQTDMSYAISVASALASVIVLTSVQAIEAEAISYQVFTNKFAEVFA